MRSLILILLLLLAGCDKPQSSLNFDEMFAATDQNSTQKSRDLLKFASQWQENVLNLAKLRAQLNEQKERDFVDKWLEYEQARFLALFFRLYDRRDQNATKLAQQQSQKLENFITKKADLILEYKARDGDFLKAFERAKDDEICVGDPCGHINETFILSSTIKAAKERLGSDYNATNIELIAQIGQDGWSGYIMQRHDLERALKLLSGKMNEGVLAQVRQNLAEFSKSAALTGFDKLIYRVYLTDLYDAKDYIALQISDEKRLKEWLRYPRNQRLCLDRPKLLAPERIELCAASVLSNAISLARARYLNKKDGGNWTVNGLQAQGEPDIRVAGKLCFRLDLIDESGEYELTEHKNESEICKRYIKFTKEKLGARLKF